MTDTHSTPTFCACGCGEAVKPGNRFIYHHNIRGPLHRSWNGGTRIRTGGYVTLRMVGDPRADKQGYVRRSQVVLENKLGRPLLPGEVAHHINGVTDDDRPENLEVLFCGEHRRRHNNVRYANGKNRAYGERAASHRLTTEQVREMWKLSATYRSSELARKFSIDSGQVSRILRGQAWPHVAAEFAPRRD